MSQETVQQSPALTASQNSWRCVHAKDKEGWLALMADDVVIEDPIGKAYTNPDGDGRSRQGGCRSVLRQQHRPHHHQDYLRGDLSVELARRDRPHPAAAHSIPERLVSTVRGVFTYKVNDAGLLTNLRGYWNMDMMQFVQDGRGRLAGRSPAAAPSSSAALAASVWRWPSCSPRRARASWSTDVTPMRRPKRPNVLPAPSHTPAPPRILPIADALIEACIQEFGSIDILVNCAGTAGLASESILKVTSAQFHDLLDAHLGTTFETCRAAAPKMVAQGGGSIINTSSFAFLGDYGGTGYPAGKGGVNGLTMAIAAELKEHGVRANVVCPGAKTRLSTGPEYEAHIVELNRRGVIGRGEHAGRTRRATTRVRRADVRLPRQRSREGRHGSDLHRRGRFRRPLRPLHRRHCWDIATTTTRRRGRSTRSTR